MTKSTLRSVVDGVVPIVDSDEDIFEEECTFVRCSWKGLMNENSDMLKETLFSKNFSQQRKITLPPCDRGSEST